MKDLKLETWKNDPPFSVGEMAWIVPIYNLSVPWPFKDFELVEILAVREDSKCDTGWMIKISGSNELDSSWLAKFCFEIKENNYGNH